MNATLFIYEIIYSLIYLFCFVFLFFSYSRYMVHMATHGRASEFGLLRRCDRWGVLEKGLVQAEIPRVSTDKILIKIEEYSVKKVETSKIRQSDDGVECLDGDKITQDLMSNLVGALKTASREEKKRQNNNDVTGGRQNNNDVTGNNGNGIISAGSSTKEGSSNKEGSLNKEGSSTEVQDPLGPVWYDSTRERTKEETDDKKNLRVLLYRSIEMNNADISNYIFRALKKAKVEPQLDSPDLTVGDTGMAGSASSRGQSQSARARGQESARGYSRGLDSSRAISISIAAAAALLLNTTIHVVCVTKDQPECQPDDPDNVIDPNTTTVTATSTVPVRYDINGHIQKENDLTPIPTLKKKKKAVQPHVLCGGFQTLFEEGSSVPGLFDSLAKSFSVVLQLDPTKSMSEKEGSKTSNNSNSVSPSVPIHTIEEGEFRRDIKLVVTYTGKWTPVLTAEKIKKPEVLSSSTSPGSRINSTTISRDQNEERDEDDDENEEGYTPIMTARSIGASNLIDTLETDVSTAAPVPMSLRTLLRTTREFSTSEQGRGYLHSHKEKLKEKERINILASEELKKLDCQTAISTAKKRQIVLQFSICHSDDANIISEKVRM